MPSRNLAESALLVIWGMGGLATFVFMLRRCLQKQDGPPIGYFLLIAICWPIIWIVGCAMLKLQAERDQ
jgi:hypothetical protein